MHFPQKIQTILCQVVLYITPLFSTVTSKNVRSWSSWKKHLWHPQLWSWGTIQEARKCWPMELLLYGLELASCFALANTSDLWWQVTFFAPFLPPKYLLVESATTKPRKLEFVQLTVMDDNFELFCCLQNSRLLLCLQQQLLHM